MDLGFLGRYFWNWWAVPYFLSFFVGLIITLLLLSKKRDDKQVQLYIVTQFFLALLSLAAALSSSSLDSSNWLVWSAINITSSLFATTTLFHFSFYLLKGDNSFWGTKKLLVIYIIPLFFSLIWIINPHIIYPDIIKIDLALFGIFWSQSTPTSAFLLLTFYTYLGVMVFLAIQNFYRMFRQTEDLELRRRAAYFVLSSLVPGIALTITLGIQLLVENYAPKLEMAIVSLSIAGAIIAYGIFKDQLFDLDVIVSKSVKYALLNIVLAWVFVISRELLIPIVSSTFFSGNELAFILAGFVVVTVFGRSRMPCIILSPWR